ISGKVKSMNLVSTSLMTFDNKLMIVPNNSIWGNVITNATGSDQRRIDLTFGIGYEDDIDQAQKVLEEIVNNHPKVLKDPAPVIRVHELADSSVNFICRPWSKTADYWTVYWDITRAVKERFDAEGISIPYPQRDVHILADKPLLTAMQHPQPEGGVSPEQRVAGARQSEEQAGIEADDDSNTV
ncbi:MAG TPA: mechanosensitive ion channel family protein, partial [Sedimenticola sp.]|nr:mechanosensitive ion channel family protein [Sedimenticola sp.]